MIWLLTIPHGEGMSMWVEQKQVVAPSKWYMFWTNLLWGWDWRKDGEK